MVDGQVILGVSVTTYGVVTQGLQGQNTQHSFVYHAQDHVQVRVATLNSSFL